MCLLQAMLSLFFLFYTALPATAQLPSCGSVNGIIYIINGNLIYNYDPSQPLVPGINPVANTIIPPTGATGLSVNNNLNGAGASPTFYVIVNNLYYYYDGTAWVNTGHSAGSGGAVNPGGGGSYIYNVDGNPITSTCNIWRYDGTANATLLTTLSVFAGPYDVVADAAGNWYVLKLTIPQSLRKYSPAGTLLNTWNVTGAVSSASGPGFAMVCDNLYVASTGGYYTGAIDYTTNTINLVPGVLPQAGGDWASCPVGASLNSMASIDTGYYCGTGNGVAVSASGSGPFTWAVLSGDATITGSGANVTIASDSIGRVVLTGGTGLCQGTDTVTIIKPGGHISAGADYTIPGCGTYRDTLGGTVTTIPAWLNYNVSWIPTASIATGANTLTPIITPTANTDFIMEVVTVPAQGGCAWKDTVSISVADLSLPADYSYTIRYGCDQDTVFFQNLSPGANSYRWDFGDGTGDTATNPVHIYADQASYTVRLEVVKNPCKDSLDKIIDTRHPLMAAFTTDNDSVCQGGTVSFTNTSVYTQLLGTASFEWDFGDGSTDTTLNAMHVYTKAGVHTVRLIVQDFVPCADTAYQTIVVDSMTEISFIASDSVLCEGQGVHFTADYWRETMNAINWDFGDGNSAGDADNIMHAYDSAGIYTIILNGDFRVCPGQTYSRTIAVKPFPVLNIGRDTTMCPNSQPLVIGDARYNNITGASWQWNNGATGPFTTVRHPGIYTAQVSIDGCVTDDSLEVFKDCYLDIPNSFTPNGDGLNDYFMPRQQLSNGLTAFRMMVYNRWGQEIFSTNAVDGRGWDGKFNGKEQPVGVYIYIIDALIKGQHKEHYEGNVTLLR